MTNQPYLCNLIGRILSLQLLFLLLFQASFGQTANFTANPTSGCYPLTVFFTDNSTGSITSWNWNFGNGNTSALQNPSAIYTTPGVYTVSLVISGSFGTDTKVKTELITVHDYPSPNFSFDKTLGCTPLLVNFTDLTPSASGSITSWSWVFGDGGVSTAKNPSYTYAASGGKNVSLRVQNEYGCEAVKTIISAIAPQGPSANFAVSNDEVCQVPAVIQFANTSTGNGNLSYAWSFGDGLTSTMASPSHDYVQPGIYNAALTVTDQLGCKSDHMVTIRIGNSGGLNFSSSSSSACLGETILFSSQSSSPIISRKWDFGNGIVSTEENPSITYSAPGIYHVMLTAQLQGNNCQSIVTKEIEIVGLDDPSFDFESDCDYNVTFTKTSISARQEWYIQGVLYSAEESLVYNSTFPGVKNVALLVYNSLGCSKRLDRNITVASRPIAFFTPNMEQDCLQPSLAGCAPFSLSLVDQTSSSLVYTSLWDFGDGTSSTLRSPTHVYNTAGTFTLSLTVTDSKGCTGTKSAMVTVANSPPIAKFAVDKTSACVSEIITFTDQSTNANFWCWDFGDGAMSTGANVTHSYQSPGTYTVKLVAKNAGCFDTFQVAGLITVRDPYVGFTVGKTCADPYTVNLTNLSHNYTSLRWDFGDGNLSDQDVSSHTYTSVGDYVIKLTGRSAVTNCVVDATVPIRIQKIKADFEVDNPKPCRNAPVSFKDKSEFAVQWNWNFGNFRSSILQNPIASYSNPGNFTVTLTATDSDGCSNQKQTSIDVLNMVGNFNFQANSTCDELTVQFNDLSTGSPPLLNWQWNFGDGEMSSEVNPVHVYGDKGNYSVKLSLTNTEGTCSHIKTDAIRFTNPIPEFTTQKNLYCIMDRILLINNSSNAISYVWDLGNNETSTLDTPITSYRDKGTYNIKLTARDEYGCEKSIEKESQITITKPDASFDATETYSKCPPLTTIFSDKSAGDVSQWQWDFGDGNSSVLPNPANVYLAPGEFNVKLEVTDVNGCKDRVEVESLVKVGGPSGSFRKVDAGVSCTNKSVSFEADTKNTLIHRWDFGDGTVEDTPGKDALHFYDKRGLYSTALVLIDENGCEIVADGVAKLFIREAPMVDFSVSSLCIFDGDKFYLEATTDDEDIAWFWKVDGSGVGSDTSQEFLIENSGEHMVELEGTNLEGCVSVVSKPITVHGTISFVPNVFTPNNDEFNEYFVIEGIENSKWDVQIFNRWGESVFKQSNYLNDWNGGNLNPGVYFYFISNIFCDYKVYKGDLTIVR